MKIGIYNPYFDSLSGGERYMLSIASCLQNDHKVNIFWDDKTLLDKAEKKLSINLSNVTIVPNIFSKRLPIIKTLYLTRKYDLIIALSDGSIPLINSKYGILHFQRPFYDVKGSAVLNKIKMSRYQKVICNSLYTKKYIDKEYTVDSKVLYPPVSIDQFKSKKKKKIIISIGRFHEFKKHEIMIQTFKEFDKHVSGWKLILVGGLMIEDVKYFNFLENISKSSSTIQLVKNAEFNQLHDLISQSSLYWHAAGYNEDELKHPENFEHFGIAPIEAMSAGCVPMVINGGGLSEIVKNNVNGYLWNSPQELIAITEKLAIEGISDQMIINAIETSQKFSLKNFCKNIYHVVERL